MEGGTTPTAGSPEEGEGPLPVVEGGRVVAMVTDRDLVARVVAASRDPNTVRCEEVATKDLVMIRPDQDLGEARRLLAQHQLDRLLVVEEATGWSGSSPKLTCVRMRDRWPAAAGVVGEAAHPRGVRLASCSPDQLGQGHIPSWRWALKALRAS